MLNKDIDYKAIAEAMYNDVFVNHGSNNDTTGHLDGLDSGLVTQLIQEYRQSEKEPWYIDAQDGTKLNA